MAKGGKWKDRIIGDYNWRFLCMPTPPWKHDRPLPPFFGHNEKLSFLVATVMGLQHALAMVIPLKTKNYSFPHFANMVLTSEIKRLPLFEVKYEPPI